MASFPPPDGIADDFLEQILSIPIYNSGSTLYQGSTDGGSGGVPGTVFPFGFSLDQSNGGAARTPEGVEVKPSAMTMEERDSIQLRSLSPMLRKMQSHQSQILHGQVSQEAAAAAVHLPAVRPKVRARRGQATDPHSISERLRRERIAERFRALQELLPNINKTDRAVMLDEVLDYVKFLRLQVKILSISRVAGTGALALVADIPIQSLEAEVKDEENTQQFREKWSDDGTEHQVAKLMEEDIGAALQFLQSKALCIMPISLASSIYNSDYKDEDIKVKRD